MAFVFPDAPTVGTKAGNYTWDGEKWTLPGREREIVFVELFGIEHPDQLFVLQV